MYYILYYYFEVSSREGVSVPVLSNGYMLGAILSLLLGGASNIS